MTTEPNLNKSTGRLAVAEAHVRTCWFRIAEHCQSGRCNCHLGPYGSVHVINGCAAGRMLFDEYRHALDVVRDLLQVSFPLELEAGDMESTLEEVRA